MSKHKQDSIKHLGSELSKYISRYVQSQYGIDIDVSHSHLEDSKNGEVSIVNYSFGGNYAHVRITEKGNNRFISHEFGVESKEGLEEKVEETIKEPLVIRQGMNKSDQMYELARKSFIKFKQYVKNKKN